MKGLFVGVESLFLISMLWRVARDFGVGVCYYLVCILGRVFGR